MLLLHGLDNQDSWMFPLWIVGAEYGIAAAWTIIYVSHRAVFPVLFLATASGMCNFTARLFGSLAPIMAQVEQPYPMASYGLLVVASTVALTHLRLKSD